MDKAITIAGRTFVPDAATAYIEFFMAFAFPLYLDVAEPGGRPYYSTLHPQTLANSYGSLVGKPINLAHLIKAYDPKKILRDHVFGTVMAVEFPEPPAGGWQVQEDPALAPCIRGVAALHKNVEGVNMVLETWEKGITPFSDTPWQVSMENQSLVAEGGFLVRTGDATGAVLPEEFLAATPADFRALGWTYVPYGQAPADLIACLRDDEYLGLKQDYAGCQTLFMNAGLNGKIFFYGVALVPRGRESSARVGRIYAGAGALVDLTDAFGGLHQMVNQFSGLK
jgi:hypothetical protein